MDFFGCLSMFLWQPSCDVVALLDHSASTTTNTVLANCDK